MEGNARTTAFGGSSLGAVVRRRDLLWLGDALERTVTLEHGALRRALLLVFVPLEPRLSTRAAPLARLDGGNRHHVGGAICGVSVERRVGAWRLGLQRDAAPFYGTDLPALQSALVFALLSRQRYFLSDTARRIFVG